MKKKRGFTLIELLVAIAIGIVVVGLGSLSLNDFNEKQKIESTRQELLSNLRFARSYAITNQIPTTSSSDTDRIAVSIDINGLMVLGTQTSGNVSTGYTFFSKDIAPKGITVIIADSDGKDAKNNPIGNEILKFSVTDGRSINGAAILTITGDDGTFKKINIDESGLIYEE